jgi:hypothetical protein
VKDNTIGATGDGTTDDTTAVQTAIDCAVATGRNVYFPAGSYKVTDGFYIRGNVSIYGDGSTSRIIQSGTSFATAGGVLLYYQSPTATTYTATATLSAGDTQLTLNSVTGLAQGDEVFLQLGEAKYDATQPYICMFNRIASISSSTITLSVPIPETVNGTSHNVLSLSTIVQGVTVANLSLETADGAQPDQAIYFERVRNARAVNLMMNHTGTIVNAQSENVSLENIYFKRAKIWGSYGASGNMIGGWGFRNYLIKNVFGMDIDRNGIYLEAEGRGAVIENFVWNAGSGHTTGGYGIWVGGDCKGIIIRNAHFNAPYSNYFSIQVSEDAEVRSEDVFLYNGTLGESFTKRHRGILGWDRDTGTMEYYEKIRQYSTKIALDNNMNSTYTLPSGIYKQIRAYTNTSGITGLHFEAPAGTTRGEYHESLVSGSTVDLSVAALTSLGPDASYPFNNNLGKAVHVYTGTDIGASEYLILHIEYYGIDNDAIGGLIQNTQ